MQPEMILLAILPMIFTFTISEAARGYAAYRCGDTTPKQYGRLTFNPSAHIDPLGTVMLPLASLLLSSFSVVSFVFGWAKPVPIDPRNFKDMKKGIRLTALARPLANFVMCLLWGLVAAVAPLLPASAGEPLYGMAYIGMMFNAWMTVLNLLPVFPFDGGILVDSFLPYKASMQYRKTEPYGMWVLLILLVLGGFQLLAPLVSAVVDLASIPSQLLLM